MIRWTTAFIDLPASEHEATTAFWEGVTGYARSTSRGDDGEFLSLLPADGDPYLKIQRVGSGHSRIHLDLHIDDLDEYAARATELGATELARSDYVVLRSPGGLTFCLVTHDGDTRPPPASWDIGASMVNQLCIDIPASMWTSETDFWSALTGWAYRDRTNEDFRLLHSDPKFPLRVLMQRDARLRQTAAHLDIGASNRSAEILRHIELGAAEIEDLDAWTRMIDPSGMPYCITDRDPFTGRTS